MKAFFLFLYFLVCLGCTDQKQEKAIQLRHKLESTPILSAAFDSLLLDVDMLPRYQQVNTYLQIASLEESDPEGIKKQDKLLSKSLPIALRDEKKKILKQSVILSHKLDQLGEAEAALDGSRKCEELENRYSLSQAEKWEISNLKIVFLNKQGQYKEGFSILYNLLKEHRDNGNILLVIEDLCAIANLFSRLGDLEKSLEVYTEVYQLAVENRLEEKQVLCLRSIMKLCFDLGLYKQAIHYCSGVNFPDLFNSSTYLKLSQCYLKLQKPDSARFYLAKMDEMLPKGSGVVYCYKMAETYIAENNEDSTALYLDRAIEKLKDRGRLNQSFSLPLYIMPVYASYASLLQKNGKLEQAGKAFQMIEPLMKDTVTESVWLMQKIEALYQYSSFCCATKQYEKATRLLLYRDSILKTYNDNKTLRDTKNWVERFEIQELTNAYENKQKQLNSSNRIAAVSWVVVIILAGVLVVSILATIYIYYQKRKIVRELENKMKESTTAQPLSPEKRKLLTPQELLYNRAQKMIKAQKNFLDSSLTLDELAEKLNTNRSSLSACINKCSGYNFNQWINRYRIEYVQKQMTASSNLRALSVEAGFKSYNTFCSSFKEYVGHTPSEYLRMRQSDAFGSTDKDSDDV